MASTTSPDGIVYPDASDPIAPLNTVFQDLAESVQVALDNFTPGTSNLANGCIQPNNQTITENFTFDAGINGVSAGPITIADGVTVTVPVGVAWSIV